MLNRAVFLDRDGVINKIANPEQWGDESKIDCYVTDWSQWEWADGAIEGLKLLAETDYKLIVVSNQSCIGRELAERWRIAGIFIRMRANILDATGKRAYYYLCPHIPKDNCACRKPKPGMIWRAAVELDIDLSQSWMVGDSYSDVRAGWNAGIRRLVHIQPKCDIAHLKTSPHKLSPMGRVCLPNLLEAANFICSKGR